MTAFLLVMALIAIGAIVVALAFAGYHLYLYNWRKKPTRGQAKKKDEDDGKKKEKKGWGSVIRWTVIPFGLLILLLLGCSGCVGCMTTLFRNPRLDVGRYVSPAEVEKEIMRAQTDHAWIPTTDTTFQYTVGQGVEATDVHLEGYSQGSLEVQGEGAQERDSLLDKWHAVGPNSEFPIDSRDRCPELRIAGDAKGTSTVPVTISRVAPTDGCVRLSSLYGGVDKGKVVHRLLGVQGTERCRWGSLPAKKVSWTLYLLARQPDGTYLASGASQPRALFLERAKGQSTMRSFAASGLILRSRDVPYETETDLIVEASEPVRLLSTLVVERHY